MPLKVLIHGINFAPELVGVGKYTGEMAEWLADRGHRVRVVTAPPYNPAWEVFPGYSGLRYSKRQCGTNGDCTTGVVRGSREPPKLSSDIGLQNGSRGRGAGSHSQGELVVFRCPIWIPKKQSAKKRLLHLASFAISSLPVMLAQVGWKPDVVIVIEPALFCAPGGWMTGWFSGAATWLHIQDFEVDAAFEMGLLRSSILRHGAEWFEASCMSRFARMSTISENMVARLITKKVKPRKAVLFPNWVDTNLIFPELQPSLLRTGFGIPLADMVALYSGTMATKQGLELLAEAARILQPQTSLWFVFCGEGPGKAEFLKAVANLRNVKCIPLQPFEGLNDLLNLADIHLLPQKAEAADLVMPSKLTGMLASGRPVVATACEGTQLARVAKGKGLVVRPGDASAFAAAIMKLAKDKNLREILGRNARSYAVRELDKNRVLSNFEQELLATAAPC